MLLIWSLLSIAVTLVLGSNSSDPQNVSSAQSSQAGPVMYFAYGSNLLKKRIKIKIKSAHCIANAKLPGWRLDFNHTCESWNGAVATITPDPNGTVWGYLWLIGRQDLEHLDTQEAVNLGWYHPINVTVNTTDLGPVVARTYVQADPPAYVQPENLPTQRQPSKTYLEVILHGAIESNLPVSYLKYLRRFPHNGKVATPARLDKLGYPFCDATSCI